jgi:copper(I)-binding protein
VTGPATAGAPSAPNPPGPTWARDLLRTVAGPVICAVVLTGLLAAWVATGGAGTLTRVRLQVTLAAVPMRAFTPRAAAAVGPAATFLTINNLSGTPDELIAASSPVAGRVILTERDSPTAPRTVIAELVIPAHGTLALSPFGDDLVLQDPVPFETSAAVPLTLTFRYAGTVTIDAPVTAPGTP